MIRRPRRSSFVLLLAAVLVSGCSWLGLEDEEPTVEDLGAGEIFRRGEVQLRDGENAQAAETFNEIERLYPFSQLAKRALIMSAFAAYQGGDYPAARSSAARYLELYPADKDAAYAQYLIALTFYDNIVDVGRDQQTTATALRELQEVVKRYPDSEFARDAQLKIDLTYDHLAGKEMEVGRYYLKRGHYVAAIGRFQNVVENYQTTAQTPEALHRIVEANVALGLEREAVAAARVLGTNFPGSDWYARSYELLTGREILAKGTDDGWFDRIYRRVILGEWL